MKENELLQSLQALVAGRGPDDPEYLTTNEWADQWNFSADRTRKLLKAGLRAGVVDHSTKQVMSMSGVWSPISSYRVRMAEDAKIENNQKETVKSS
mgnify:CR=1 FL=1